MFGVAYPHTLPADGVQRATARSATASPPGVVDDRPDGDQQRRVRARSSPDDPLARLLARAVQDRSELPRALLQRYRSAEFARVVAPFEERYETLPDELKVPAYMRDRLAELERLATGGQIEDSSDVALPRLAATLVKLGAALPADDTARTVLAKRVTDLLIASCLVVSRGRGRRAEILTPEELLSQLDKLVPALRARIPFDSTNVGKLGRGTTLAEDMLLLNLLNMPAEARAEILGSELFTAIRASGHIAEVMLASSGHEEQHYLSTCGIASRDQEVLTHVGSIAGLVWVSRKVLAAAAVRLKGNEKALRERHSYELAGGDPMHPEFVSVYDMCDGLIARATAGLDEIERDAFAVVKEVDGPVTASLEALTTRWGTLMQHTMQILAPVADPDAALSVLTTKYIGGHWNWSALVATIVDMPQILSFWEFGARMEPPDEPRYRTHLATAGLPTQGTLETPITKTRSEWEQGSVLKNLWEGTVWRGGVLLTVPGHSLYLKAVRRDGAAMFLLGEPKGSAYQPYTPEKIAAWLARYKEVSLPFDPFVGS